MNSISYTKPEGFHDYDPRQTAQRRAIETGLLDLFRSYGYDQITVPTIEYAELYDRQRIGSDLYYQLLSSRIAETELFPASETDTSGAPDSRPGRRISDAVLRPELTAPVARWLVSRLIAGDESVSLPARLACAGQVFRKIDPGPGRLKEFRQIGVELIGGDHQRDDLEILCLACDSAKALDLPDWRLHLGHAGLYRQILRDHGLADDVLNPVAKNIEIGARISLRLSTDDETFLNFVRSFLDEHRSRFPSDHPAVREPERLTADEWRRELPALHGDYLRDLWSGPPFELAPAVVDRLIEMTRLGGEPEDFFTSLEGILRSDEARRQAAELRRLSDQLRQKRGVEPVLTWAASRSLAYYTGLTFELHCPAGTSPFTSICGGGRYDDLHRWIYRRILKTRELRGLPAVAPGADLEQTLNGVGLAFSVERLATALDAKGTET